MTIAWPSSPSIGTQVVGPRGVVWSWDGHKWIAVSSSRVAGIFSSATEPSDKVVGDLWYNTSNGHLLLWNGSAWVSTVHKIPGITDGSEAAPGEVGEIIEVHNPSIPLVIDVYIPVAGFTLPAGDWDIQATLTYYLGNRVTMYVLYGTLNLIKFAEISGTALMTQNYITMYPVRANLSAPFHYELGTAVNGFLGAGAVVHGAIRARRLR